MCVGVATHDTIVGVAHYPGPDERVIAEEIREAGGGPAATAAVTATRLGVPAALIAAVGDDPEGVAVRTGLLTEGVDVTPVIVVPGARTARSVVVVSRSGDTRAILTRPATAELTHATGGVPLTPAWVHLDHAGWAARHALGLRRGDGPLLSLDIGYPVPDLDPAAVDLFAPTASVVAHLRPGEPLAVAVTAIARESGTRVVATDGARGVIASDGGPARTFPAFPVAVRSTLGAGDVFHGALVASLAVGEELAPAITRASAAAALSCAGLDGRSAIPTAAALADYLANAAPTTAAAATAPTAADASATAADPTERMTP